MTTWSQVAVIVAGYVLGLYFQNRQIDTLNKRIDDFRQDMDKRFDDLYRYLDIRFREIERRLTALEEKLGVKP